MNLQRYTCDDQTVKIVKRYRQGALGLEMRYRSKRGDSKDEDMIPGTQR